MSCSRTIHHLSGLLHSTGFTLESKSILLTCPAPQCTDVGWGRRRRCAGPPTSPARPVGTAGVRPPSWRRAPWDSGPRSQTWLWPRSALVLQRKGHKPLNDTMQCWDWWTFPCAWCTSENPSVLRNSPSSLVLGPLSTSSSAPGSLWGLSLRRKQHMEKHTFESDPRDLSHVMLQLFLQLLVHLSFRGWGKEFQQHLS